MIDFATARVFPGPTLVVGDPRHRAAALFTSAVRHVALLVAVHATLPCLQKFLHLPDRSDCHQYAILHIMRLSQ